MPDDAALNVLVVVANDYPDMEAVRERLRKGSETEHRVCIRRGDRRMKDLLKELEIPFDEVRAEFPYQEPNTKKGLSGCMDAVALHYADFVILYHTPKSTVTDFFYKKATTFPYDRIFASKIEINVGKVDKKRRKGRPQD